jgi:GntR family transcriptional regulator
MQIDLSSHVPIYLQIADGIRAAVAAGIYRPGEVLPSLRAMATEIHVNPNTVQRAYDELEREGLVYSQRGRGLFVSERAASFAQSAAGDSVRRAFSEAIRAGQIAGMTADQVRQLFDTALQHSSLPPREQQGMRAELPTAQNSQPNVAASPSAQDRSKRP